MPYPYSKQEMTQETLLYLHIAGEVCAIISSVILQSVQKLIDHTTCTGATLSFIFYCVREQIKVHTCEIKGSHSGVSENLVLLGYDAGLSDK